MSNETALHDIVRERYGAIARESSSCCGPGGCGSQQVSSAFDVIGDAYAGIEGHVPEADLKLGCGVPTRHAGIRQGHVVLDLGSGAGNDAFVARRLVGAEGRVIGVDMTPEMIARARRNAASLAYDNVEFRQGQIEALPVEDGSIDVAISNCVLNLVPDKARAFAELFRVLKPGGRFCISDIVSTAPLPPEIAEAAALYVGCVAGALPEATYLAVARQAGLRDLAVVERKTIELGDEVLSPHLSPDALRRFRASRVALLSVTVTGSRPGFG
jgi:arsenite methyltransferase